MQDRLIVASWCDRRVYFSYIESRNSHKQPIQSQFLLKQVIIELAIVPFTAYTLFY